MWKYAAALGLLALTACGPSVPNSEAGAGFNDYSSYDLRREQRDADRRARAAVPGPVISDELPSGSRPLPSVPSVTTTPMSSAAVPAAPGAPLSALSSAPAPAPVPVAEAPQAAPASNGRISDEQDFQAVSARESIQSDAERLAQNRAAYQQVAPSALPQRPGGDQASLVEFALSTTNSVGKPMYKRSSVSGLSRFNRACAKYGSSDQAQEAFLKAGGPERDRAGVDPDGDGFACFWDPTPFRNARLGAAPPPVAREVNPAADNSASGG